MKPASRRAFRILEACSRPSPRASAISAALNDPLLSAKVESTRRAEVRDFICFLLGHPISYADARRTLCQAASRLKGGHRGVFPKSYANDIYGWVRALPKPVSLGGLGGGLAEQAPWDVEQRESSSLLWQFIGVGFDDYLDGFLAGVDFDAHGAVSKIEVVPSACFAANNSIGHTRAWAQ